MLILLSKERNFINILFCFKKPSNKEDQNTSFLVGSFNSNIWDDEQEDENGEAVIKCAESHSLSLIHDPKRHSSFNNGREDKIQIQFFLVSL